MDQETKQPSADTNTNTNANQSPSADSSDDGKSPTMEQLMQGSPALSPLCGWLKCLRKPALSMQYSIQKRHIPDLDTEDSGQKATTKQEQSAPAAKGQIVCKIELTDDARADMQRIQEMYEEMHLVGKHKENYITK